MIEVFRRLDHSGSKMPRLSICVLALIFVASACSVAYSPDESIEAVEAVEAVAPEEEAQLDSSSGLSTLAGVSAAMWGENVTITINGDTFTFESDGLPNHEMQDQYAVPADPRDISADNAMVLDNPSSAQNYNFELPLYPEYSQTTTDTDFGTIGLMISGSVLYNPYEGGGGVALDANFDVNGTFFIDDCNAHPQGQGAYHYHGVPHCITDLVDVAGEHSSIIGVMIDGFPIYGPQDHGGGAPADLDECNGHFGTTPEFDEEIYHYHLVETGVYSVPCYHGTVDG